MFTEADWTSLQLPSNVDSLHLQLRMLGDHTKQETVHTVQELGLHMSNLHPQTRGLFEEVEKLLQSWLCNTVTQKRWTHMALLHVHKDILDDINIQDEGVYQHQSRVQVHLWSTNFFMRICFFASMTPCVLVIHSCRPTVCLSLWLWFVTESWKTEEGVAE